MSEDDLRKFVGVLFLSGYHILPQQQMYWDRRNDANIPIFYQAISKNRFFQIKKYLHCADDQNLDLSGKLAQVQPIYDLMNTSIKQFSFWHKDFSIDEQMIPYFGMHSAKQTMRNKSTRFGYKNFVLTSTDGYPYHVIPYSGAKWLAGTLGKGLTSRVVIDFLSEFNGVKPNLAIDNWYKSTKVLSILTALGIQTVCTARVDRLETAPILSTKVMMKKERGEFCYSFDKVIGLHLVQWIDTSVVTTLSNCLSPYHQEQVERFSRKQNKKIQVQRPKNIDIQWCNWWSRFVRQCCCYTSNKY